jgi:hypothetical protein
MAAAGEMLPLLGGAALTDNHAALWLAVLELLAQLQRKTGAGRAELLRAIDAAMAQAAASAAHGEARKARPLQKAATAGPQSQTSGAVHQTCAACSGAHRAQDTCGNTAARERAKKPISNNSKAAAESRLAAWEAQLARLATYVAAHGDCKVPQGWAEDPGLASWVSHQRVHKKKLDRGETNPRITAARVARLDALGFEWNPGLKGCGAKPNETLWEAQLARLTTYKTAHGDCNVPRGWAEDPWLGGWVCKQRVSKRKLDRGEYSEGMTAERASRLMALGFAWNGTTAHPNEVEWESQLARLAAYKAAHGDCNVPKSWAEDPRLGRWVNKQRALKWRLDHGEPSAGMTAARAARLTALGVAWEASRRSFEEKNWELQIARLVNYKAAHGDCNVPVGWAEDPRLGSWVDAQRQSKRKLDRGEPRKGMTVERAARLTALGFVWDRHEVKWESQLARLAAYKAVHGDCNVRNRWAEDPRLGGWVSKQRVGKQKLDRGEPSRWMTLARAAKLDKLGFAWELSAAAISKQCSEGQRAARLDVLGFEWSPISSRCSADSPRQAGGKIHRGGP